MTNRFSKYIKAKVAVLKGDIKLYFIYPKKFPESKIESLLPPSAEKLIGKGIRIRSGVSISPDLHKLGSYIYIGEHTIVDKCSEIGSYSCISSDVKIGLINHALDHLGTSPLFYEKSRGWIVETTFDENAGKLTTIGADVLISANVLIMKGVSVGTGAVVGAGAVVTKDVPPYAVVAGVPARIIRFRFSDETIEKLLQSRWWSLPVSELKNMAGYFSDVNAFLTNVGGINRSSKKT